LKEGKKEKKEIHCAKEQTDLSHLLKRERERESERFFLCVCAVRAREGTRERDGERRNVVVVRLFMIANLIS